MIITNFFLKVLHTTETSIISIDENINIDEYNMDDLDKYKELKASIQNDESIEPEVFEKLLMIYKEERIVSDYFQRFLANVRNNESVCQSMRMVVAIFKMKMNF